MIVIAMITAAISQPNAAAMPPVASQRMFRTIESGEIGVPFHKSTFPRTDGIAAAGSTGT
jgi:hypothetical protein